MVNWYWIFSLISFAFTPMLKAVMDRIGDPVAFDRSVFRRWPGWSKEVSANKPLLKGTKYRVDPWHLSQSFLIFFVVLTIGLYHHWPVPQFIIFHNAGDIIIDILKIIVIFGVEWNLVFNPFYNKIFYREVIKSTVVQ